MRTDRFQEIAKAFPDLTIAVVGDIMSDHYLHGRATRMSAEAPVPVIEVDRQSTNLGGAANVANNLRALSVRPLLFGVVGNDAQGEGILRRMREAEMDTAGVLQTADRPTTTKMRVIAQDQQVARADIEATAPIGEDLQEQLLEKLTAHMAHSDAVIFEDYNKGTLTEPLIRAVIERCRAAQKIVTVDPKFENFFAYQHVTVFKPNRHETETSLGRILRDEQDIRTAGKTLLERLACEHVLLTLGENGMAVIDASPDMVRLPIKTRNFRDSSGAGDTVIATLTAALAAEATMREAAALANYAAGVVCGRLGVQTATAAEILEAVAYHESREPAPARRF